MHHLSQLFNVRFYCVQSTWSEWKVIGPVLTDPAARVTVEASVLQACTLPPQRDRLQSG